MNTCAGSTGGSRPPSRHPIRLSSDREEDYLEDDMDEVHGQDASQKKKQGTAKGLKINSFNSKKNNTQKPISFIAPGHLAKNREFGKKTSDVGHGRKRARIDERKTNDFCSHGTTGGLLVQKLVLHFGDSEWQEEVKADEISYLDLLRMGKQYTKIYSTGFSFTDGVGRPLRDDNDVLALMKEHEDLECIHVYLFVSKSLQPSLILLPEDNPSCVTIQSQPRDVTIEENTVEDPGQVDSQKKKRKQGQRGVAKGLNVQAERIRLGGARVGLTWDPRPKVKKAVAKNGAWLDSTIGKVTRCRVSPGIEFWKDVDELVKEQIWSEIEDNFAPVYRDQVLSEASKRFSSWKNKMKERVTKYMQEGGVWPPPILHQNVSSQSDWDAFLRLIQSPSYMKRAETNQKNRAKNTSQCHPGRLSLPGHRWKRTNPLEDPLGDDPIEIWAAKHKNSKGQFGNTKVADDYRRLIEIKERIAPGRRATHEEDEKIFAEVFGSRRGYMVGLGPTKPIQSSASQCEGSSSAQIPQLEKMEKIEMTQNELKEENIWLKTCLKGVFATLKRLDSSIEMPEMLGIPKSLDDSDGDNEADDVDMDDGDH